MTWELVDLKNQNLEAPHIWSEVLSELKKLEVWSPKIAKKLAQLLDAQTLNNSWDTMDDNKVQLEALKLLLKMHWVKVDQWLNINLFNIPNPNDKLKY